jgi:membrane protein
MNALHALAPRNLFALFKAALKGWKQDNCLSMGAALAFYSLLSLAPLLVLIITVAGLVIGRDQAHELLLTEASGLLGETGAEGIKVVLENASSDQEGILQTVISGFMLLIGATTVFGELQDDLNRIWKCEAPKAKGIWGQIRKRLLSFGLIVSIGFLLLLSLAVSAAVAYVGSAWFGGAGEAVAHALEFVGSLLITTLLFDAVFKILPSRRIPWGDVMLGSFITALLFGVGKFLIGMYIGKNETVTTFGAAGTLIVTILWVYYSSQIFFLGAEFTRAYSTSHGSRRVENAANSEYGSDAAMVERAKNIVKGRDPVLLQKRV